MYPQIKFSLNKDLDKWVGYRFLDHQRGGRDFGKSIIRIHPELSSVKNLFSKKEKQIVVGQYVDSFYEIHQNQLEKVRKKFEKDWERVAQPFFKAVDKVFAYPWPKGLYVAYLSIFPCGPRFLENKTFQVFYLAKEDASLRTAHELLHFLFYDYFEKAFPEIRSTDEKVWILSEVLNFLILDSPEFYAIFGASHPHPYPNHLSIIERLKPKWENRKDLNSFLRSSLGVIEKAMVIQ